jgi:hypothetical protein
MRGPQQWDKAIKRFQMASGTANWSSHVMRATVGQWLQALRVPELAIKAILNHSETRMSGATAAYTSAADPTVVREALQKLADLFDRVAAGEATEVVTLRPETLAA